jgi:phospholipid transport system substrate-binding protein
VTIRPYALAALLTGLLATEARAANEDPTAVVNTLHETLLGVMKEADALGYSGRYDRIAPALEQSFDFDFMARFVLGQGWQELDAAQQQSWIDAFKRITIATYAGRFSGYTGEQFNTLGQETAAQDTVFVKTVVDRPDADDVELTYRLRKTQNGWRIIDIYQKGTVSELALRRSEYSSVLKREGFDKLLEVVNAKIAAYAAGKTES